MNKPPSINLQSAFSLGAERLENHGYAWSIEQTMLRVFGKHVVKFGGIYFNRAPRRFDEEIPQFTYPNLAALLANKPSSARVTFGTPPYIGVAREIGFFGQDDFRISRNLILNLGLRYEYFSVYHDTTKTFYNPDGIGGAVATPIRFRPFGNAYDADRNNFAPRVGLAWTLDGKGRNVMRAGFGMAYAPFSLRTFASSQYIDPRIPFRITYSQADINQNGFKFPMTNEDFATFAKSSNVIAGVVTTYPGIQNPQNMQWSLDIQRRLSSSITFQTGYVGNKATHVTMTHAMNQQDYSTGIRPYPNTSQFTSRDDADFSHYHSWQSSLRTRASRGLAFNAHYTWSRVMAVANGDFWLGNDIAVQDEKNWRGDLGPTSLHVPHVFAADAIYEIPSPVKLLKSFQLAAIFTASSGSALNVVVAKIDARAPAGLLAGSRGQGGSDGAHAPYTGVATFAVTLSRDGGALYAVNAGANSVAVIPLRGNDSYKVTALIPTAYEPHDITFSADGTWVYIVNGKSATGPNPGHLASATGSMSIPNAAALAIASRASNQYQFQLERASLVSAPVPSQSDLDSWTKLAAVNNFYGPENGQDRAAMNFLSSHIKHVVYIVKENRKRLTNPR